MKNYMLDKRLNSSDKVILELFNDCKDERSQISMEQGKLGEILGITRQTVARSLNRIIDSGYLTKEYLGKTRSYRLRGVKEVRLK